MEKLNKTTKPEEPVQQATTPSKGDEGEKAANTTADLKHPVVRSFAIKLLKRAGKSNGEAWNCLKNILVTINAINSLQFPEDRVLDKYSMSEYQILPSFQVLIKPLSLTLGANGIQAVDYLSDVSVSDGIEGTVLSPSRLSFEFDSLVACLNPRTTDPKKVGVNRVPMAVSDATMRTLGYVDENGEVYYYSTDVNGIWTTTLKAYKRMIVPQNDVADDIAFNWVKSVQADADNRGNDSKTE